MITCIADTSNEPHLDLKMIPITPWLQHICPPKTMQNKEFNAIQSYHNKGGVLEEVSACLLVLALQVLELLPMGLQLVRQPLHLLARQGQLTGLPAAEIGAYSTYMINIAHGWPLSSKLSISLRHAFKNYFPVLEQQCIHSCSHHLSNYCWH